jgi:sarcosine oxidase/L-pipecolate oxidase
MEGKNLDRACVRAWRWRSPIGAEHKNVLMEGSAGPRALANVSLVPEAALLGTQEAPRARL